MRHIRDCFFVLLMERINCSVLRCMTVPLNGWDRQAVTINGTRPWLVDHKHRTCFTNSHDHMAVSGGLFTPSSILVAPTCCRSVDTKRTLGNRVTFSRWRQHARIMDSPQKKHCSNIHMDDGSRHLHLEVTNRGKSRKCDRRLSVYSV